MLKSIAFIGYGFVGQACHKAFEHNTEAIIIDPKYSNTVISDLQITNPPIIFVCINAPTLDDRTVDASVIYDIFEQLVSIEYKGLVVLKSTLPPDIVYDLYIKYGKDAIMLKCGKLRYIYSPEFLREATWEKDALNPSLMILAGNFNDCHELQGIYKMHSHISYIRFHIVDYRVAALAKYTINSFLANKVVFMNQIYQLYSDMYDGMPIQPESWKEFTDILATDLRMGHSHMQVPGINSAFGYGGTCFPKDVKALIGFDKEGRLTILRETELVNTQIRLAGRQ
jgi:UDPglucose 6-dehydrogenase